VKKIIKAISTPTARSTAIFYVGSFLQNILRYFFHLILLRFLTPPEYGEFLSYLSLTYLLGIPMGTIAGVATKFVADFRGKKDDQSVNLFFYYLLKQISPITFSLGFILIIFSGPLANIFKAHSVAFIVLGVSMMINLYQTIIGSYLVAFQKFVMQTMLGFLSVIVTILLSILFIKLGFGATGAVLGQLIAGILVTIIIFLNIKQSIYPKIVVKDSPQFSLSGFTGWSFIYALGTMSLMSSDILLVRALFDTHTSGLYSALSILGRMILFGLTPLIGLMLPLAAHRHSATGSAQTILIKLGAVISFLGFIGAGVFALFPSLIIRILSGAEYISAAPLLPVFAFSMMFFGLSQFLLSYLMATGRPKANVLLLLVTILQPAVIYLSRSSISSAVWSQSYLFFGLFFALLVYTTFVVKNRK